MFSFLKYKCVYVMGVWKLGHMHAWVHICVYKEGGSAKIVKRKLWEMEGLERNAWTKVETDSKE